ncbi:Syntaxin-10 [Boothiomyces macroporosus]|uniref:t-SNARE affecting a late Golgi compartment protein 1 n=1 Tax=Boothiomyces macroporosus TaxID=261099 RepID=A0AAD5UE59_9FUNG|nr:Syntaxin-10 [Boothiomyces macroporosus]
MADDPFNIVKREVEQSLAQVQQLFQQRNSTPEKDQKRFNNDIRDRLQNINADLDELDDTIKIVQGNPSRFKLDRREIDERKQFVSNSRRTVEELKSRLVEKQSQPQAEKKSRAGMIENEQMMQQQIMQSQDKQMDEVAVTIRNMKEIGRVMGDELEDQTRLLGEVEDHVDATQNRLQDGMKRMKDFIKANSDIKQQVTIIILIVVLVILAIIAISS